MTAKRRQLHMAKPLIVEHDGERVDVDRALLDIALEDVTMTLPEILADLQQDRQSHATLLADYLKSLLVHLPQAQRAEAISNLDLWIQSHADGNVGTMRDILGLPVEAREDNLCAGHLQTLKASAISDDVIAERGYQTVTDTAKLKVLGFAPAQCRVPGLLIPLYSTDGDQPFAVYRPDNPRTYKGKRSLDGMWRQKMIKYEMPKGETVRLDCPPRCLPTLADPAVTLWVTEGQKKADALASAGLCAIALLGVWNWLTKHRNELGQTDWGFIKVKGRTVNIVFDTDVMSKIPVRQALDALTIYLQRKGAVVNIVYLPNDLQRGKLGVDDWLANGHIIAELQELIAAPRLVESTDDGDSIRALITQAAQASDREPALRTLFESLSQLSGFQLVKYRGDVQDRLRLSAAMFERMISQVRRGRSQSQIIDGQLTHNGDPLCNFAAEITHQLTLDDGLNKPSVKYTLAARLADGGLLPSLEIESEEFEQVAKWVPRHWGADGILYVPPSQAYQVARAIKETSKAKGIKRETVFTFTGWTTLGNERAFLTSDGAITGDGQNTGVRVELGHNRLNYYRLPAPPADTADLREAVKHSLGFLNLAPLRVTAPLWCAMYGAPLMEVCSLNAVIWIYGPTQSRKSTLTMLALAHFGEQFIKSREYYAPMDWMSTMTALEGAMFAAKNVPIVIDDFAPQFAGMGESRDIHKKAHQVVRSVGNRSSRGRANADLTERAQRPPRGIVVATAELPLTGMSIVGRMIYVPVERGDVALADSSSGPLDQAQALAGPGQGMYARAMAGYVSWLARHWDQVVERARANHERANQYARTVFPSTQSRLMDYYADLITYARTALEFAVSVGAIEQQTALLLGNEQIPGALVDLLSNQSVRVAGQSPVVRLFEAIAEMVISKKCYFAPRTGSAPTPPRDALLIGWYGYEESCRVIYLRLSTCLQVARDYWQRTGEGFETSTDALQREIWQAHLLSRRSGESYTVSVWVADESRNVRVLVIDSARIPEIAGVDIYPGGSSDMGNDGSENEEP